MHHSQRNCTGHDLLFIVDLLLFLTKFPDLDNKDDDHYYHHYYYCYCFDRIDTNIGRP